MERLSEMYAKETGVLGFYMDYLNQERKALPSTAYNYYMILRSLAKFLKHRRKNMDCQPDEVVMSHVSAGEMLSITEDEWVDYLTYCRYTANERKGSLAVRISAIRGFYVWLAQETKSPPVGHIIATRRPKAAQQEFIGISEDMEEAICENMRGSNEERNICMVRMFLRCGLGLQELCALNLEDIELKTLLVGSGHGGKGRSIPLDETTEAAINAYLAVRTPPTDGSNAFFVSYRKGRMRRGAVEKLLRKAVGACGPSMSGVTVRDLQLTAKGRIVAEHGLEGAASILNVSSPHYYQRAAKRYAELFPGAAI